MSTVSSKHKSPARRKTAAAAVRVVHWRDDAPCECVHPGARLLVEARDPFMLHFGRDGWQEVADLDSQPLASGWHTATLDLKRLGVHQSLEFTRRFIGPRGWEHHDWQVRVEITKPGQGGA